MPQPNQDDLKSIIKDEIDSLLKSDVHFERHFEQNRWEDIYALGLHAFLNNLRKVHRYFAGIEIHLSLFRDKHAFNVNPVDLFVLEAIRIFENKAYRLLANSKTPLVTSTLGQNNSNNLNAIVSV